MKSNRIIHIFVIRGFVVGLFFPTLAIILCYSALTIEEVQPSILKLHELFPLLWIIDCAPIVLGAIAFLVGNRVQKSDRVLSIKLERANQNLVLKNDELVQLISEKEVLLKEVHHRVKNNLQIINGLLSLQSSIIEDKTIQDVFQSSQRRIASMSMIHEMLYHSKDLSKIDFNEYSKKLIDELIKAIKPPALKINSSIDVSCSLNIDTAIPLGILINEIVTNSLKHGFLNQKKGIIHLQIKNLDESNYAMILSDDGNGFEGTLEAEGSTTLGLLLISQLAVQLNGNISKDVIESGTQYTLNFQEVTHKK